MQLTQEAMADIHRGASDASLWKLRVVTRLSDAVERWSEMRDLGSGWYDCEILLDALMLASAVRDSGTLWDSTLRGCRLYFKAPFVKFLETQTPRAKRRSIGQR